MPNEIMNISGVDCYEKDGTAYLDLEAVARGLGFTTTQIIYGKEYINVRWKRVDEYLAEIGFATSGKRPDYIPENIGLATLFTTRKRLISSAAGMTWRF